MIRIAAIQNFIVPYEVSLYTKLAESDEIMLCVFFCSETSRKRTWLTPRKLDFPHRKLPSISISLSEYESSFNPTILSNLKSYRPDVVVISGSYHHPSVLMTIFYSRINRLPIILRSDEHAQSRRSSSLAARFISRFLENAVIGISDAIICPGSMARDYHTSRGVNPTRIFLSPYTTDSDADYANRQDTVKTTKDEIKRRIGIREGKIVLFVGRVSRKKGVFVLLDAFKKLNGVCDDLALVIVGEGPNLSDAVLYSEELDLQNVHFLGAKTGDLLKDIYLASDVFVLPSLSDLWGLVVNEAMLCRLPVVVTNASGASEMIADGKNGYIVNPGDVKQMYDALAKIVCNMDDCRRMGEASFSTVVNHYNIDERVNGFMAAVRYVRNKPTHSRLRNPKSIHD